MHWVIQASVFSEVNLARLVQTLERAEIEHTLISIDSDDVPTPEIDLTCSVYVCGAWKAARLAKHREWKPGSFLNDNFSVDVWIEHLPGELLNESARTAVVSSANLRVPMFVRPLTDTKMFDGQVFTPEEFEIWREENPDFSGLEVSIAPLKKLLREYRLFVVEGRVVTGSLYRQAGEVMLNSDVDPEATTYVESVIERWSPAEAFVVDVALTDDGYRVIEFNNINSSGFYESDVERYVDAIERAFGEEQPSGYSR